jgi:hypothetical protein
MGELVFAFAEAFTGIATGGGADVVMAPLLLIVSGADETIPGVGTLEESFLRKLRIFRR